MAQGGDNAKSSACDQSGISDRSLTRFTLQFTMLGGTAFNNDNRFDLEGAVWTVVRLDTGPVWAKITLV